MNRIERDILYVLSLIGIIRSYTIDTTSLEKLTLIAGPLLILFIWQLLKQQLRR